MDVEAQDDGILAKITVKQRPTTSHLRLADCCIAG